MLLLLRSDFKIQLHKNMCVRVLDGSSGHVQIAGKQRQWPAETVSTRSEHISCLGPTYEAPQPRRHYFIRGPSHLYCPKEVRYE